jgi:hypothetical protein
LFAKAITPESNLTITYCDYARMCSNYAEEVISKPNLEGLLNRLLQRTGPEQKNNPEDDAEPDQNPGDAVPEAVARNRVEYTAAAAKFNKDVPQQIPKSVLPIWRMSCLAHL